MLTNQQLFDNAWNGFKAQDWQYAKADKVGCKYRMVTKDSEILKCGIGHSIPDEKYDSNIESTTAIDALKYIQIYVQCKHFAMMLQSIHDRGSLNTDLKQKMIQFAENHQLTIPK